MDGRFQAVEIPADGVLPEERLARFTRLQAIFDGLTAEFPGNPHLARQARAIGAARAVLSGQVATGVPAGPGSCAEVAALFRDLGARDADLAALAFS